MTTTVAMLYPGHAAEDDYPLIEAAVNAAGGNAEGDSRVRLPVVITDIDSDDHTVDAMLSVGEEHRLISGARLATEQQPDALMWACTSGSFLYGWKGAHEQAQRLADATGLPASSTSLAFAAACAAIDVSRVAIAATYPEPVASRFTDVLGDAGIEVVTLTSHDIETATKAGELDGDGLSAMLNRSDSPRAQALLIPDTALHTAMWVADLERRAAKPVLTANQVTAWMGLRLAGNTPATTELGTLFTVRPAAG